MALRRLGEALPRLGGKVGFLNESQAAVTAMRVRVNPWRAWYNTTEWRRLRWQVLVDENFTCRRCGVVADSPGLVADHIVPHRGCRVKFLDRANLQCLCARCHNSAKQAEERAGQGAVSYTHLTLPTID